MNASKAAHEELAWAKDRLLHPGEDWYASKRLIFMNRLGDALAATTASGVCTDFEAFSLAMGDVDLSSLGSQELSSATLLDAVPEETREPGVILAAYNPSKYAMLKPLVVTPAVPENSETTVHFAVKRGNRYVGNVLLNACTASEAGHPGVIELVRKKLPPVVELSRIPYLTSSTLTVPANPLLIGEAAMHRYIDATYTDVIAPQRERAHMRVAQTIATLQGLFKELS
jgi:hypothetical protein